MARYSHSVMIENDDRNIFRPKVYFFCGKNLVRFRVEAEIAAQ